MSTSSPAHYLTVDEYLKLEERSSVKHEYVDGRMFAMTGVKLRHNMITGNIHFALRSKLSGSGCCVFFSDVKLRVQATNSFYYPDIVVACTGPDQGSLFVSDPKLVVEVLSRSTAATDRREKVVAYKQVPSVREYLIVHTTRPRLELHRKNLDGTWILLEFGLFDEIVLESLTSAISLPGRIIYEDIEWKKDWMVQEGPADEWCTDGGSEDDEESDDSDLDG